MKTVRMLVMMTALLCLASLQIGAAQGHGAAQEGVRMSEEPLKQVLEAHTSKLMSIPGVVGTAESLCSGRPCIKVYVRQRTPELEKSIPSSLEGYPVILEESGDFHALPKKP